MTTATEPAADNAADNAAENAADATDDAPQFATTRRVEFCDTDMAGIAHFANFHRWMEQAEHDFFRSLGLPVMASPQDENGVSVVVGWPRVSAQCSYEKPAYRDDILQIGLDVQRIGYKSLSFEFTFHTDRDGERVRLARGKMKTACCKCRPDGSLESVPIPEHYLEKIHEKDPPPRAD